MSEIEIGKCVFCGEDKQVNRLYLEVTNKHFNDNIKGKYATFVYYCNDCGIKVDEPLERIPEKTKELTKEDFTVEEDIDIKINPKDITPTDMEDKAEMDKLARELVELLQRREEPRPTGEEEWEKKLIKLCAKAYILGREEVVVDLPSLVYFIREQLSLAREEGRKEILKQILKDAYMVIGNEKKNKLEARIYISYEFIENMLGKDMLDSLTNQSKDEK